MTNNHHSSIATLLTNVLLLLVTASGLIATGACTGVVAPEAGVPTAAARVSVEPWPGQDTVVTGDNADQFGRDLSGLFYEPAQGDAPAVLWAAQNRPGTLYRLVLSGETWTFDTVNGWGDGKALRYPGGTGDPDAESVTRAELNTPFLYIATERKNNEDSVSRLSILRFDNSASGTELTATHEWDLTADIPPVSDANKGLEAITWIPDSYLVSKRFLDESRGGVVYNPSHYPNHGAGLFVVGVEETGTLYAYALDHTNQTTGTFHKHKITTFPSGHSKVMGLEFDRGTGTLWAACDDTCDGEQSVLVIVDGKFVVRRIFASPGTPKLNNEGIAIAPESECRGGFKKFYWSDDSDSDGNALRIGSIPCGPLF